MVKKLNLFISLILVIAVKGEDVETAVSAHALQHHGNSGSRGEDTVPRALQGGEGAARGMNGLRGGSQNI